MRRSSYLTSLRYNRMIFLDRLLFPTDGSSSADRAHSYAASLADRFQAELHVIHVDDSGSQCEGGLQVHSADILDDLHGGTGGSATVPTPRVHERRVTHASAAEGILEYATEYDVGLIVLGTHGRRGVRRLVLGSVAEEVGRRATCPVLTIGRAPTTPDALDGGRLLVPIDFSEHQVRLLAHACELARAYDMTMTLCHVLELEGLPDLYRAYADPPEPGVLASQTESILEGRADEFRDRGLEVNVEVRSGHAADTILSVAEDGDVDLLAIATHGRSGVERVLLGSVAEKVLRHAHCPVFTVKAFGTSLVRETNGTDE